MRAAALTALAVAPPLGALDGVVGRFDPATLQPAGPTIPLVEPHSAPAFSPSGRRVALGVSASPPTGTSGRVGLWVVDPARTALVHQVQTGIATEAVAFPSERIVAGLTQGGAIVVVDPRTGRIVRRTRVGYSPCAPQAVTVRGVAVFANEAGSGRAEVTTVDGRAAIRTRALRLDVPGRCVALAADGRRAYVVGAAKVAAVEPRTLRAATHAIGDRAGRRSAVAVGGALAVAGTRGARVLDTRTWRTRWRDPAARQVAGAGDVVVTSGGPSVRTRSARDGRVRWTAPGGAITVAAGHVYVNGLDTLTIRALASGRVTATRPALRSPLRLSG